MTKYITMAKNSFLSAMTYRANLLISIVSKGIQLLLSLLMWAAIFRGGKTTICNYNETAMFQYLVLTGILAFVFTFEPIFKISDNVRTGKLNTLLLRPINLNFTSLAEYIGSKIFLIVLAMLGTVFMVPTTPFFKFMMVIYLVISIVLWHELMFLIGLFSFWVIQMWPLRPIINAFYMFLGGLLFPLDVLPAMIYQVLRFLPVSLVSSDLVQTVIQSHSNTALLGHYLVASVLWIGFLHFCSTKLLKKGLMVFEGVGA